MSKQKDYWGGFINGHLDDNIWGGVPRMPTIFNNKRDAKEVYQNVRKIKLVPVKEKE